MSLHIGTTLTIFCCTLRALYSVSRLLSILFLGFVLFVTFVCPFWLKWIQRYKHKLQGPWDYDTEKELDYDNL